MSNKSLYLSVLINGLVPHMRTVMLLLLLSFISSAAAVCWTFHVILFLATSISVWPEDDGSFPFWLFFSPSHRSKSGKLPFWSNVRFFHLFFQLMANRFTIYFLFLFLDQLNKQSTNIYLQPNARIKYIKTKRKSKANVRKCKTYTVR